MPELHWQLKRLKDLHEKCGCGEKKEKPTVDMSKMSEYEKHQYRLAEQMQRIRGNILDLDNLPDGAPQTKKVDLRQQIRKDVNMLDRSAQEAKRWAKDENRKEEYEKLIGHVRKTQNLWNGRFQEGVNSNVDPSLMSPKAGGGITKMDEEMSNLSQPMVNLRDDEEFGLFFD